MHGWFPFFRDAVQVVFWIVLGTVTVRTYRSAKRTLLQPIRTEVFKQQLQTLSEVLRLFVGKSEVDLRDEFAFSLLIRVNAMLLLDNYAEAFLGMKIDRDKRPYNVRDCPFVRIWAEDGFFCQLLKHESPFMPSSNNLQGTEDKLGKWEGYEVEAVRIPTQFETKRCEMLRVFESPLLPDKLLVLLQEYLDLVSRNVVVARDVLSQCAQDLPGMYKNPEMNRASIAWIINRYNDAFLPLEPNTKQITTFVRGYFMPDKLVQ